MGPGGPLGRALGRGRRAPQGRAEPWVHWSRKAATPFAAAGINLCGVGKVQHCQVRRTTPGKWSANGDLEITGVLKEAVGEAGGLSNSELHPDVLVGKSRLELITSVLIGRRNLGQLMVATFRVVLAEEA